MTDHRLPSSIIFATSLLLVLGLSACSDDNAKTEETPTCTSVELYDSATNTCITWGGHKDAGQEDAQEGEDSRSDTDAGHTPDAAAPDAHEEDVSGEDTIAADAEDADAIDPSCDMDHDGELSEACGGFDCDDNNPAISPHAQEICDLIDNNCNGQNNEYLECTFYASSPQTLYKVDPFAMTATVVHDAPDFQDIDTHQDGTLFGIKRDGLYHYDAWSNEWVKQGGFGTDIGDANGLAIDREGTAFITSDDKIFSADLHTGRATFVGNTGNFKSSGDCVVDKGNTLYMTSKARDQMDTLVEISRETGHGTKVGESGAVGFARVYALTAAWGRLYGLTSNGELIEINQRTGVGTLIHTFNDISFWGAASTPNR